MEDVAVVRVDLAKSVFQVHGVDAAGQVMIRQRLSRAKLPRCLVDMETCASANYWAEQAERFRQRELVEGLRRGAS